MAIFFVLLSTQRNLSRSLLDYPGTNFGTCRHACLHWTSVVLSWALNTQYSFMDDICRALQSVKSFAFRTKWIFRVFLCGNGAASTEPSIHGRRWTSLSIACPYRLVQDLPGTNCQSFSRNRSRPSFRQHTNEGPRFWIFGFGFSRLHSF